MSERHLSDDVSDWPSDPYELFGIPYGTSLREIRRVYARLIRTYKPEHAPEEFRRIRDAYEILQWRTHLERGPEDAASATLSPESLPSESLPSESPPSESSAPADDEPVLAQLADELDPVWPGGEPAAVTPPPATPPAPPTPASAPPAATPEPELAAPATPAPRPAPPASALPLDEDLEHLWQQARTGDLQQLYRRYSACHDQSRGGEILYVRLYWLLILFPELDTTRDACQWLFAGLQRQGLKGRLLELYLAELERNAHEAVSSRAADLLRGPIYLSGLIEFLDRRCRGAATLERWDVIAADHALLRERVSDEDLDAWAMMLLNAIRQLAWSDAHAAQQQLEACRREVETYSAGHPSLHEAFIRCDFLIELVGVWRSLAHSVDMSQATISALRSIIRDYWLRPFAAVRPFLLEFLKPLAEEPLNALGFFDRLAQRHGVVLHQLGQLIETLDNEQAALRVPYDGNLLARTLAEFLDRELTNYAAARPALLRFCVQEGVSGDDLIEALVTPQWMRTRYGALAETLAQDGSFRYLTKAIAAFWS